MRLFIIFQCIFPNHLTLLYDPVISTNIDFVTYGGATFTTCGPQAHLLRRVSGNTLPPGGSFRLYPWGHNVLINIDIFIYGRPTVFKLGQQGQLFD